MGYNPIPYADDYAPTYSPCRTIFSGGQWAIPDSERPKDWRERIAPRDLPAEKPKVYRDNTQIVRIAQPKAPRKIMAPMPRGKKPRTLSVSPGQKFGRWEVIREAALANGRNILCRCACGKERVIRLANLLNGHSTRCGNNCALSLCVNDGAIRELWLDDGCILGIARDLKLDKKTVRSRLCLMAETDEQVAARLKTRHRAKRAQVIPGKEYGRLKVVREIEPDKCARRIVLCKCECGKEKPIRWYSLTSGKSTACSKQRHVSASDTI